MSIFFPFVHERNKKEKRQQSEPLPLYIEIYEPQYEPINEKKPEEKDSGSEVIIIQL